MDQFESLCEIEEDEGQNNNEELQSDEDVAEHSSEEVERESYDKQQHEDTLQGNETHSKENLDQLVVKGEF